MSLDLLEKKAQITSFDKTEFRNTLGGFATGVTVVTAKDLDGEGYVGMTANSFNSVSMDPPLVLWSIGRNARSLSAFEQASNFAIHILAEDQIDVSNHFATQQDDKFAEADYREGIEGVPVLNGCSIVLQCKTKMLYDGGDHTIIVGEVLGFENNDKSGLAFSKGKYSIIKTHPDVE